MARRLFLYDDPTYTTSSMPSPPPHHHRPSITINTTASPPSSSRKLPQHNPPFDSSMALTVVVLLTALFFMGFFSIYIRRLSEDDPTVQLSRRRRYRGGPLDTFSLLSDRQHASASRKGLDPTTIRSLPVYSYHGNAKYQIDCPICLSEFEEKECVKTIPNCRHVFHVECIDAWLCSHVSCPVCRSTRLFETNGGIELGLGVTQERVDHCVSQSSTVDSSGAFMVMGTATRVRRTSSCSSLGQRAMLQRTSSF